MQEYIKSLSRLITALLFILTLSISASVLAEAGSSGGNTMPGESFRDVSSNDSAPPSSDGSTQIKNEAEIETHSQEMIKRFKQFANQDVQNEHSRGNKHNSNEIKKSCEKRKKSITNRMAKAIAQAEKHKAVFDKVFAQAQKLHDEKGLNAINYADLLAAAQTAQTNAQASIVALKAVNINVDCTQTDSVATNIAAMKEAIKNTRDSLKDYRKAIVSLISALNNGGSDETDSSSTTTN